jgi:hypothetical protein
MGRLQNFEIKYKKPTAFALAQPAMEQGVIPHQVLWRGFVYMSGRTEPTAKNSFSGKAWPNQDSTAETSPV